MKEKNAPEPEIIETKPEVVEPVKTKKERKYIALSVSEINELMDDYRKVLKKESGDIRELFVDKIKELEKELRLRSIKAA